MLRQVANFARRRPWAYNMIIEARKARAQAIDRALNIHTVPQHIDPRSGQEHCLDAVAYEPMDYPLVRNFLRVLNAQPDDIVYDIGCGMGRILCLAARQPVKGCVGIEISPTFAEMARDNARHMRGRRAPIDIIHTDATLADYSDGTVFFLFNPFGERTLRQVLLRIQESLRQRPRPIRIGYGNPVHEDILEECGWLHRYATYGAPWYERPSSFWRSVPLVTDPSPVIDQPPEVVTAMA
jgi:SAM-dependent methyltransferase